MKNFSKSTPKSVKEIVVLTSKAWKTYKKSCPAPVKRWLEESNFSGSLGEVVVVPGTDGSRSLAVMGSGDSPPELWDFAALPSVLKDGTWAFSSALDPETARMACIGWGFGTYAFDRYKTDAKQTSVTLVWPKGVDAAEVERLVCATRIGRDLVTTPANDMGPQELEDEAKRLAKLHRGAVKVVRGDALLTKNYPAIHAVGRASDRAPRLIDLTWGNAKAPKVTLVGKGVVFDTGGLDIKSAAGMLLMKKDMGGAAMVLGLAHAIMDAKLNVRLRVLVSAVENAINGDAFRPSDVLQTRNGMTVEVGNTDAEGRLVLCDALAEASREKPEVLLDFATLTGAARVALGTEVPALFCNDDDLANGLLAAGQQEQDPMWRLPLHQPYARMLRSSVADTNNMAPGGYGGAITAALFLEKFVEAPTTWGHIDLMAYNLEDRPGRPKGGEAMAIRATYVYLRDRFGAKSPAKAKKTK